MIDAQETFLKVSYSLASLTPTALTKKRRVFFSSDLSDRMVFITFQVLNLLKSLKQLKMKSQ